MFATVAIVVVVFVIVALLGRQFSRTSSMERSIRSYKRRLGTIAEVVELTAQARTETSNPTPLSRGPNDTGDAHPEGTLGSNRKPEGRIASGPGDHVYVSKEGRLVFGDSSLTPVVPPKPPIYEDHVHRRTRNRRVYAQPVDTRRLSRIAVVIVVLLVAIGGVVGGVLVSKSPTNSAAPVTPTTVAPTTVAPRHSKTTSHHAPPSHSASTTTSHLLSSTATSAVFSAPSGTYTVAVYVDGLCWLGFQHSESKTGPWLAMATLGGQDPKSYQLSTKGSLAITVGAPSKMTKVLVNGTLLGLPAQRANSYVITLR